MRSDNEKYYGGQVMKRYDLWQRDGEGYLKEAKGGQLVRWKNVKELQAQLDRAILSIYRKSGCEDMGIYKCPCKHRCMVVNNILEGE